MGYKTTSTKISSAKTTRSRQTTTYQNPSAAGVVVTGKAVTAETSIFLDIAAPGSARSVTPVTGGGGATITSITYLDADNLPTNANAVSTTGGNILIVGTGFSTNSRVFVNNVQVTNTYINSSAIRATLSSSTVGNVGLYLFSSANTSGALSSNAVRFSGAPTWVTGTSLTSYNGLASNIQLEGTGDGTLTYSLKSGSGSLPNGISLLSTGYLTGTATGYTVDTTVQFTLIVTDSENQAAQQTFNYSVLLGDTYFNQTTLLLNADQGNTFVTDSSTNNFQVNVVGGAGPSRFTPFSANGYSAYFDGTGDYLTIPSNSSLSLGGGSFTVECWVYISGAQTQNFGHSIIGTYSGSGNGWNLTINRSSTALGIQWINGSPSAVLFSYGTYIPRNTWTHIAIVRSSTATNGISAYVNGALVATGTDSTNDSVLQTLYIGAQGTSSCYFPGYISNARIVKGTALYTANFTPSTTALSTVANTSLLTLRDSVLADDSPYNFTITRNGDVKLVQFTPFNAYALTPNSYSVYFDGTGDYLTVPHNTALNLSSGDFTIEGWFYCTALTASNQQILNKDGVYIASYPSYAVAINSSGNLILDLGNGAGTNPTTTIYTGSVITTNTWNHFACIKTGSTIKIYQNGIQTVSTTQGIAITDGGKSVYIGYYNGGSANDYFKGYISNLRILKGTALYTANFTPSTTALTSIANTSILTCQSTTIIDSNTTPKTITINGNPNVSAANPFYETVTAINNYSYDSTTYGASAYFDGTGDYLFVNSDANSILSFGTNDFTIESWVYPQTRTNVGLVQISDVTGGLYNGTINTTALAIVSNKAAVRANGTTYTSTSSDIQAFAWSHFALVRSANISRLYVNGRLDTTLGTSGNISDATNYTGSNVVIGGYATSSFLANGYMSDLRIVKGNAVYTGTSFIPPTAPLTAVANTSLLTLQNSLGANSAQFIDESINTYVVTRVGNAAQGSFSPLVPASWSAYFDGTGDYLTVPDNETLNFGSQDFTIELWLYPTVNPNNRQLFWKRATTAGFGGVGILFPNNDNRTPAAYATFNGSTWALASTSTIAVNLNSWNHLALVRNGTNWRLYVNGQFGFDVTLSGTVLDNTAAFSIGAGAANGGVVMSACYISNFRVLKGTALYTANFTPATSSLTTVANTSVLTLQSPAITDNSPNNFTITRNGDTKIVPFGPFVPHTVTPDSYSYYFSGTSDYISTANANLAFGTSDFTVETWVYNRFGSNNGICQISNVQYGLSDTSTNTIALGLVNNKVVVRANNTIYTSTGTNVTANTWNHLALTRASNVAKLYINGTLDTTIGSSGSITDSTNYTGTNLAIGGYLTTSVLANAYISNFRTVKGTAIYLENFTVTTAPLTAVANTVVLTAQSNTIVDTASVNTFTGNGNTLPRVFNPFGSTTTQGIDYNPLEHGGSVYFDGTGDYLTTTTNTLIGTGDYTLDWWVYHIAAGNPCWLWDGVFSSGSGPQVYITTSGTSFRLQDALNTPIITYTIPNRQYQWVHYRICRSNAVSRLFINGIYQTQGADSTNHSTSFRGGFGARVRDGAEGNQAYFGGFRAVLRALNTSNNSFIPDSTPFSAIADTFLLWNFTNSGVVDSAYRSTVETVGDAMMTNTVKKYNSGSYVFDGTGDYMRVKSVNTDMYAFGIGDFTIEMWIYPNLAQTAGLIDFRPTSTNGAYIYINITSTQTKLYVNSADVITGGALTAGVWTHIALTRSGTSTKLFLNGVQSGSTYTDSTNYLCGSERPSIGMSGFGADSVLNGYIDDLRITKGYARYTANFTPPAVAFPDL